MTQHVATNLRIIGQKDNRLLPHLIRKYRLADKNPQKVQIIEEEALIEHGAKFRAEISFEESVRTRHVVIGTLPRVSTTSLNPGANLVKNVIFDMLRLKRIPARSRRKVVRKDQLPYFWSLYNWVVCLGIPILESLFQGKKQKSDQNTPSNSPRARGTK